MHQINWLFPSTPFTITLFQMNDLISVSLLVQYQSSWQLNIDPGYLIAYEDQTVPVLSEKNWFIDVDDIDFFP